MTTVSDLCGRGLLPESLPPCFSSARFAPVAPAVVAAGSPPKSTLAARHNLFRWGSLRRQLSIVNPIAYAFLADCIATNWVQSIALLSASAPSGALTRPTPTVTRALGRRCNFDGLPRRNVHLRAGHRYVVRTDISRFYHSIYTHTIEWAIHTKAAAKANFALPKAQKAAHWGEQLDLRMRALQDRQSIGIPIGPDASLLVAELLLSRVDASIHTRIKPAFSRYIDDYEITFRTFSDAERAVRSLQEILQEYELGLNPSKTAIHELPIPIEERWVHDLRLMRLRDGAIGQARDLGAAFDRAFEYLAENRDKHVLRFFMGILCNRRIRSANWAQYQSCCLQAAAGEPGVLSYVLPQVVEYRARGFPVDLGQLTDCLNELIVRHAPLGHGSEVAWCLWGLLAMGLTVDSQAAAVVPLLDDPIVAVLFCDAYVRQQVSGNPNWTNWHQHLNQPTLHGDMWLFAYEANFRGWFPGMPDYVAADPHFSVLKTAGVTFYFSPTVRTPAASPQNDEDIEPETGGGGGGGPSPD